MRKLGIAVLWLALGLTSWQAAFDGWLVYGGGRSAVTVSTPDEGTLKIMDDGSGIPTKP